MNARVILRFVVLAIVAVAVAWLVARLNWRELGVRLAGASPAYLIGMLVAWIASLLLRPVRFRFLLDVLGQVHGTNYRTVWAGMLLGATANSIAPARAGDVVLAVFLRQRLGVGMHHSFTVIVADWACDFACVVVAFLGALMFAPVLAAWTDQAIPVLVGILALGIAGLWATMRWRRTALRLFDRLVGKVVPRWQTRGHELAAEFLEGLAHISKWRASLPLLAISASIWTLTWLSYWLGLCAVYDSAPPASAAFNMSAVALSFIVPLGPGGLGAFEAATVLALSVFGIPLEPAIAFAVIAHIFQLGTILAFTAIALVTSHIDHRILWTGPNKR